MFIEKQQGNKSILEENLNIIRINAMQCEEKNIDSTSTEKLAYC